MGRTAWLMAGQGSQFPGMAKDLYESEETVKELFDSAEELRPGTLSLMFDGTAEDLRRTDNTQPCVFLADMAAATALRAHRQSAAATAGFSLGEIAALAVSGMLAPLDAFRLVCLRGELMEEAAERTSGAMIAILRQTPERVEELCEEAGVYAVNYNCPGQIVAAGTCERIKSMKERLEEDGIRFIELAVGGAFHTPYMQSASDGLRKFLAEMPLQRPSIPLYANRTARPYPDDPELAGLLVAEQVSGSVRWEKTIRNMAADGITEFIECGPGRTLAGLVRKILPEAQVHSVGTAESLAEICK